jgi:hypothetical protein
MQGCSVGGGPGANLGAAPGLEMQESASRPGEQGPRALPLAAEGAEGDDQTTGRGDRGAGLEVIGDRDDKGRG